MSQENVEIVRKQIDDLRRRDWTAWLEAFDPDVEFRLPPEWPDEAAGTGREAALASMKGTLELVEDLDISIHEVRELGDDRLLVIGHVAAKGAGSGVPVDFDRYDLLTMREGKIVRSEIFLDRRQALEAAGLRE